MLFSWDLYSALLFFDFPCCDTYLLLLHFYQFSICYVSFWKRGGKKIKEKKKKKKKLIKSKTLTDFLKNYLDRDWFITLENSGGGEQEQ